MNEIQSLECTNREISLRVGNEPLYSGEQGVEESSISAALQDGATAQAPTSREVREGLGEEAHLRFRRDAKLRRGRVEKIHGHFRIQLRDGHE